MRYNIFYKIHKALRCMLYETGIELQRVDFNSETEAASAFAAVRMVMDTFEKHAYSEDSHVFPAVGQYEPSIVDAFEREHIQDHELSDKLKTLLAVYASLETDAERIQLGSSIRRSFVEFLSFNLVHMAKEEDIINNLLWRYYGDEDILDIERRIISSQEPGAIAVISKWMLRGLSNQEIIEWLKTVEKSAPRDVVDRLLATAELELSGPRFRYVRHALTEGQLIA